MPKNEKINLTEIETRPGKLPVVVPEVFNTSENVAYLKQPGVAVISVPYVDLSGIQGFLDGFPEELEFFQYLQDPTPLPPAETLCKFAGQLCYESFGPKRTVNEYANAYFENIKESGHGSVLEHANVSMLWWGISRNLTHELVRHRAGFGFSQVSQRYVGGHALRFVERQEYQEDPYLHEFFEIRANRAKSEYEALTEYLLEKQKEGDRLLSADHKTDLRKKVRQTARSVLPGETEAPVVVTANIRAWRHFLSMRASEHSDTEIRRVAFEAYRCLYQIAPLLFGDYEVVHLSDGTHAVHTKFPKV